ncbi:MAG: rhodanese-like domain-containing protein [Cellulomonas sp.]|nr:rhodanese-like domain-containing protein [Cellulomonas sp.]
MTYAGDLTPTQAHELLTSTDALLVDVRTPDEWEHIGVPDLPGVAFVPWVLVPGSPPNPDFVAQVQAAGAAGRTVIALCRSGQRSIAAANALTAAGLGPVYNVLQGFEGDVGADGQRGHSGWRADGLPWRSL